jgi:hypothetical protein
MCYGCLVSKGGDSRTLAVSHSSSDISLRTITPAFLIDTEFKEFSSQQVAKDGVFDIYLHRPSGPVSINGGVYGAQTIQTVSMDDEFYAFLSNSIKKLDSQLALDIRLVDNPSQADAKLYLDTQIDLGEGDGVLLGLAIPTTAPDSDAWELLLNFPAFAGDRDYLYYAALHEIGHSLGLEHPFEDFDNDFFETTDPFASSYPEESVMSYRSPLSGRWPTSYSSNDLAALKALWGESVPTADESTLPAKKIIGTPFDDELTGGFAAEFIQGKDGDDVLIGGGGEDKIEGGLGSNQFFSLEDGASAFVLISSDGSRSSVRNRQTVDEIAELGIEDRIGIIGASPRRLRFRPTSINSTAYGPLQGIGISIGKRLEAVYTGQTLTLSELRDLTVGLPNGFTGDLG